MTRSNEISSLFDVSVRRTGEDTLRISWKTTQKNLRVSLYRGSSPETLQRRVPVKQTKGQNTVTLSKLNPNIPHYFKIVPEAGKAIIIGERRLPLKGTVNSRDLGGYETTDGRRLKRGKIFRSDHLARLTDGDIAFLQRLKIQCVCDFRTSAEVRKRPDRFPVDGGGEYLHLPVNHLKFEPSI